MKEHYYVALDIGSSSVKAVVGEKFHEGVNIIGTGQTYTDAVVKGTISDFDAARSAITDTVKKAKISSDVDLDEVFLRMPITDPEIISEKETLTFDGEPTEINGEHIETLLEKIREKVSFKDKEIVNIYPQYFIVDDLHEVVDPKEMLATESLSIQAGVITTNRTQLINTIKCVEDAGLEVLEVFSDATNFEHILSESEVELGAVIIDIGHHLTQYAYYERGELKAIGTIPYAGEHVTNDLSEAFNTSYEFAERMKHQFGHAFYEQASEDEIVKVPQRDNSDDIEVSAKDLADIIELRVEEILIAIFKELQEKNINKVAGGFVVTGGTANLPGIKELLQDLVAEKVRIHIPNQMGARKPEFSSVISTISSSIMFDELLDYVTIDNYESEDESHDDVPVDEGNFFSNIFKMRREENNSKAGKVTEKHDDRQPSSTHEPVDEQKEVSSQTFTAKEPLKFDDEQTENNFEMNRKTSDEVVDKNNKEAYTYSDSVVKTEAEDNLERQEQLDDERFTTHREVVEPKEKSTESKGDYFRKLFKNLFE